LFHDQTGSCGSLACSNVIENLMSTVRRLCRNLKPRARQSTAMRWTAAAMQEVAKSFRRLKAYKQLPTLSVALEVHKTKIHTVFLPAKLTPLNINIGSDRFACSRKSGTSSN